MNDDILKGKWSQLKGSVKEQWGKLTDDEIDELDGRREQLVGKVQERYGLARDQATRDVDNWLNNTATRY
jgi:uncharacterized protein YjbJ (UPF0337 family)